MDMKKIIEKLKGKINKKSLKYGSYSLAVTAVIIAIIVVLNALLGLDVVRDRLRVDITKNKRFSLSDTSVKILKELNKDIEVIILTEEKYFREDSMGSEILEILKQYNLKSSGKVTTRFVDVVKDPTFITRELDPNQVMGIQQDSIIVKCGNRIKVVSQNDMIEYDYNSYYYPLTSGMKIEQVFTSAIKNVTADASSKIYFVQGHGEKSIDSWYSDMKSAIVVNNYEIEELTLKEPVPDDASVLFFLSPTDDLTANELDNLQAYLEKGGDAIFLVDVQKTTNRRPNFDAVFERYSLSLNNDMVYEFDQRRYLGSFENIIPIAVSNDVTMNLDPNSITIYMTNCRSVDILKTTQEWIKTYPLFMTSDMAESVDNATQQTSKGPFCLGALSEYTAGVDESRIALIGNSLFVLDEWMGYTNYNGLRYIVSILNWMQDEADAIYIPSKSLASEPIDMSESTRFIAFIVLSFVLPLAIVGAGLFVWIRRKHL